MEVGYTVSESAGNRELRGLDIDPLINAYRFLVNMEYAIRAVRERAFKFATIFTPYRLRKLRYASLASVNQNRE